MVATKRSKKKVKKVKKKVRNSRKTKNIVMTNKIVSQNFRNRRVPHFSGGFSGAAGGGGGSSSSSSSSPGFFIQQPMPFPPRPPDTNKFLFQKSVIESFDNSNKNLGNILNKLDNLNISQEIVNGILQVNLNDNNDDILAKSEMSDISSLTSPSFDNHKSDMDVSKTSNLPTSESDMDISKNSLNFQPAEIQPPVEIEMVSMDQSKRSQPKDEKDEKKPKTQLTTNHDEYDYAPRIPATTVLGKRRALYGMEIDDNSIQSSVIDPVITRNIHDVIADRTQQARQRGELLSITSESLNNL